MTDAHSPATAPADAPDDAPKNFIAEIQPGKPVFNRTIGLRDRWAKQEKKG